jgi:hypothetical protein
MASADKMDQRQIPNRLQSLFDIAQPISAALADIDQSVFPFPHLPISEGHGRRSWANTLRKVGGDTVHIDRSPINYLTGAVAALIDLAIRPCGHSGLNIQGMMQALEIINEARSRRSTPSRPSLSPTGIYSKTFGGHQAIEELKRVGEQVASPVRYRMDFVRAYSTGEAVSTFAQRCRF